MEHPHHAYPRLVRFADHHEVAALVALTGTLVAILILGSILAGL